MSSKIKPWQIKKPKEYGKKIVPLRSGNDKRIVPLRADNDRRIVPLRVGAFDIEEYDKDENWRR